MGDAQVSLEVIFLRPQLTINAGTFSHRTDRVPLGVDVDIVRT